MKNNKVLALIILTLIFILAACGGGEETAVSLAEEVRVEEGEYAFQPPVGYDVSVEASFVEMSVADDPDTKINLFGTALGTGMSLDIIYDGFTAGFADVDGITVGEREAINVNGLNGFTATLMEDEDETSVKGKIVALGNDVQAVIILAGAEDAKWDNIVSEQVDAVVNSITFFGMMSAEPYEAETTISEESEADNAKPDTSDTDASVGFGITTIPMPKDAENVSKGGGDKPISFQTSLSLEDTLTFYRDELVAKGYVERDLLTVVDESAFSIVFDEAEGGKAIVIQGVALGETVTVSIGFEDL